jgi:hypothetical protein
MYTYPMWQDWVISVAQWLFIVALLPSVFHADNKPTLVTSVLTAVLVLTFAYTYYSLDLLVGSVSAVLLGITWITLAVQRYRINKNAGLPPFEIPRWFKRN